MKLEINLNMKSDNPEMLLDKNQKKILYSKICHLSGTIIKPISHRNFYGYEGFLLTDYNEMITIKNGFVEILSDEYDSLAGEMRYFNDKKRELEKWLLMLIIDMVPDYDLYTYIYPSLEVNNVQEHVSHRKEFSE